ncbi:MAG: metalloregulator ArsR/SmtB family transcription factor [Nocardiaceae bacterium]|nr:metalloregulator ArsR/SmtB family transcription factor [Nocardiaceae bacterium]
MGDRAAKSALFDGLASVAKALGNGRRAEIIDVLSQGERSVEEIAAEIDQTVANTSQHLQHLLRAGLVRTRRDGNRIHYALADAKVAELWALVRDVSAAQIADIERLAAAYLGDRGPLVTVSRSELARRLAEGDVVVIDVRPEAEFAAGHIAGAVSLPIERLARQLTGVPHDREIIAYCRGPYCVYADDAVRTLHKFGRKAARLEDGYPEWARAGLPVAVGA